ncbi:putative monooxygenase [Geobacter sp. OR-1]|uniref:putative quinol monooxygenase n=1 Tax=Geobacter sp. OR-1 TaxID=1266765 RepID=UPI0005436BCF|nr:putative quinol monooxygenase [Geobacter sp. OR-1]GAM09440.1 putative monooxygenase [Geobacter sp. OR-1]
MSTVTVVAKVTSRSDAVDAVKAELLKLVTETTQEEGCIEYRLHQDNEDPAVFVFYENWDSLACLEQHLNSKHSQAYLAAVDGLIADKVVHKMTGIGI